MSPISIMLANLLLLVLTLFTMLSRPTTKMFWSIKTTKTALAAALAITFVTATGTMTIKSNCPYPVWMQIVPQNGGNPPWQLLDNVGVTNPFSDYSPFSPTDADGVAYKLGLADYTGKTPGPITIVEVAWNDTAHSVDIDASDLDANGPSPFYQEGYVMWVNVAASDEYPTCQTIHCAAGDNPCTDAYWYGKFRNVLS
jgi:hypothetical protein